MYVQNVHDHLKLLMLFLEKSLLLVFKSRTLSVIIFIYNILWLTLNFLKLIFMGAYCEQKGAVWRCLGIYLFIYSLIGHKKRTQYIVAKEPNLEDWTWMDPTRPRDEGFTTNLWLQSFSALPMINLFYY
jgi:hypothetical protein